MARRARVVVMVAVLISGGIAVTAHAAGTTYYVDTNGDDSNDGLSWATAFATIQEGIDEADEGQTTNYDIVDVNTGTYVTGPIFLNNNNQKIVFEEGVVLKAKSGFGLTDYLFKADEKKY